MCFGFPFSDYKILYLYYGVMKGLRTICRYRPEKPKKLPDGGNPAPGYMNGGLLNAGAPMYR